MALTTRWIVDSIRHYRDAQTGRILSRVILLPDNDGILEQYDAESRIEMVLKDFSEAQSFDAGQVYRVSFERAQ